MSVVREEIFEGDYFIGWLWPNMARPFKPYGKPPSFDLDEFKDSFEIWETQWQIFIDLSTVDTELDAAERPKYKANLLKSCMSTPSLAALLSSGLTAAELIDPEAIIKKLRERCNAGRNHHVWRHQFASRSQRKDEAVDDWLCDLRDLARKCEFATGCCAACEPTRILGQVIFGVYSDEDRRKLLEKGPTLTLEDALITLRSSEAAIKTSSSLKSMEALSVNKMSRPNTIKGNNSSCSTGKAGKKPSPEERSGCWNCGAEKRHSKKECPAAGKECRICHRTGHYASCCFSKEEPNEENP